MCRFTLVYKYCDSTLDLRHQICACLYDCRPHAQAPHPPIWYGPWIQKVETSVLVLRLPQAEAGKKENKNNNMMHVRVDFASSFLSAIIEHALVTLSPATLPHRREWCEPCRLRTDAAGWCCWPGDVDQLGSVYIWCRLMQSTFLRYNALCLRWAN